MKKLKRLAALIVALSLIASLGAGASATSDTDYLSVKCKGASNAYERSETLYYGTDDGVSSFSSRVDYLAAGATFTITNNHPTKSAIVYFFPYYMDGADLLDDADTNGVDLSGKYYCFGHDAAYNLQKDFTYLSYSAGNGFYWTYGEEDGYSIKPGQTVTVGFDSQLVWNKDTIYQLVITLEDHSDFTQFVFFLEDGVSGFTDVGVSADYADAVTWAVENGITNGVSKNSFDPDGSVTRAQAITFLWRAYGKPEPTITTSKFKDVTDKNAYYYKAVLWAAENGITTGVSSTWFDLKSEVSYGEIITFLCRAAGGDAGGSDWAGEAMVWAIENDIDGGRLLFVYESRSCPRYDVVYFLYNQLGK